MSSWRTTSKAPKPADRSLPGLGPALWAVAAAAAVFTAAAVRHLSFFGQDFDSAFSASRNFVAGRAIYASGGDLLPYLYPPPSAIVGTPFTLLDLGGAETLALVLGVLALLVGGLASARLALRAGAPRPITTGAALLLVAVWQPTFDALSNLNTTLVVAPVVPVFLLLTLRRRHLWAAILLGLSFAVKPLLLPLIVVPFLYRRSGCALVAVAVPVLTTLASLPFVADGDQFFTTVVPKLLSGDAGRLGPYNMSLANLDDLAGFSAPAVVLVRLSVAAVAVAVAVVVWRSEKDEALRLVETTGVLFVGFLSAGGTDESHYQLVLVPLVMSMLVDGSRLRSALGGVGVLLFAYRGEVVFLHASQASSASLWRAIGLVLVLVALALSTLRRRPTSEDSISDQSRREPAIT